MQSYISSDRPCSIAKNILINFYEKLEGEI